MKDLNNIYKDDIKVKEESQITIVSLNTNRVKKEKWKEKNKNLRNFLYQKAAGIISFQEVNLN